MLRPPSASPSRIGQGVRFTFHDFDQVLVAVRLEAIQECELDLLQRAAQP